MRPVRNERVGAWRALGEFKLKEALWPDTALALLLGGGGALYGISVSDLNERLAIVGDLTNVAGALIAVTFTALAIVVSLPSDSYLRLLAASPDGGMRRFLDPFLVAIGTQVLLLLATIGYQLAAEDVRHRIEETAFLLIGFLFVFGLLDIVALARQLVRHGLLRAANAEYEAEQQGAEIARLEQRRG